MILDFEINKEFYIKYLLNQWNKNNKNYVKKIQILVSILILILPIIATFKITVAELFFLIGSILFYILFPKVFFILNKRSIYGRSVFPGFLEDFIEKCTISFGEDYFWFTNSWIERRYYKDKITEIRKEKDAIILEISTDILVIPLESFEDNEAAEEFIKFINKFKLK
ncbi:YcxB family protein [Clostridium fallax]|uniref:YcxB-like protein n=1 Tax=Clostridium fallax TaxID=1533 RepID=A0A1M4U716_9CLOT|nr:YcxB family protein [Clostridium fallax]SHE52495.1 hypothetical protein SAMN05443638_10467 [Clostridium fallax]SQB06109.1 Uncharacterised protein [Clostridium fallax]